MTKPKLIELLKITDPFFSAPERKFSEIKIFNYRFQGEERKQRQDRNLPVDRLILIALRQRKVKNLKLFSHAKDSGLYGDSTLVTKLVSNIELLLSRDNPVYGDIVIENASYGPTIRYFHSDKIDRYPIVFKGHDHSLLKLMSDFLDDAFHQRKTPIGNMHVSIFEQKLLDYIDKLNKTTYRKLRNKDEQ